MKNIKHERTPILKKYITLPILLSPERDEELLKLTDQVCLIGLKEIRDAFATNLAL